MDDSQDTNSVRAHESRRERKRALGQTRGRERDSLNFVISRFSLARAPAIVLLFASSFYKQDQCNVSVHVPVSFSFSLSLSLRNETI